jgi:hypothetical protein
LAAKVKKTFLGFRKAPCERCSHVELLPLSGGYRLIYGLAAAYAGVAVTLLLATGSSHLPGGTPVVFGLLSAWALVKDDGLRREATKRAQRRPD